VTSQASPQDDDAGRLVDVRDVMNATGTHFAVTVEVDNDPFTAGIQDNSSVPDATCTYKEVTLTVSQIPAHSHPMLAAAVNGNQITPAGNMPASSFSVVPYINDVPSGDYVLAAWTPRARPTALPPTQQLTVGQETLAVEIRITGRLSPGHEHNVSSLTWERY